MTDREAFEACPDLQDYCDFSRCPDGTQRGIVVYNDPWTQGAWQGWQAALASERAKQAEPVPFNAPGKAHVEAMLGSAAPPAVPAKTQGYTISRDEEWNLVVTEGTYEDDEAVRLLRKAKRAHRYFDTGGDVTSCPAADDLGPCDCGANAFNAAIDAYLAKVVR